jgi:ribosomal protein S18 acetylase RimI-like enzyme
MAAMAAELVRFHHALDPARFFLAAHIEKGYRGWFAKELANPEAIMLVGTQESADAGYAYGRIEARDWNMLLDRHAALHDVFVQPTARNSGLSKALIASFVAICKEAKVPRVVLHSASANTTAQAAFAKAGFRPSMVEMFLELEG